MHSLPIAMVLEMGGNSVTLISLPSPVLHPLQRTLDRNYLGIGSTALAKVSFML